MTDTLLADAPPTARLQQPTALRPFLPALVFLFVGSGCAALIYEIVWLQLLGLVIGASAISLAFCSEPSWAACALAASFFPSSSRAGSIPF